MWAYHIYVITIVIGMCWGNWIVTNSDYREYDWYDQKDVVRIHDHHPEIYVYFTGF